MENFLSAPNTVKTLQKTMALGLIGLLLVSCAHKPDLGTPPTVNDATAMESTESFKAAEADWPATDWWKKHNDPQLDGLIAEAMQSSPDLAQAQARVHSAEGLARQAGASLLPTLDANASVAGVKQSYNNGVPASFVPKGLQDTGKATLDFNYEFDFWGRNRAALSAAKMTLEAAKVETEQSTLVLSTSIADAYADLAKYYADHDAAMKAKQIRIQSAKLVRERFDNALENIGRVHQAEAARAASEAEVAALDEFIRLTRNRIAALLGKGPDRGLQISRPKINILKAYGLPSQLSMNLIGRRPDIVASKLLVEVASKRIDQANTQFYPNINLAAYIGVQSLGLDYLTKSGSDIAGIGPAISLPIFDGGQREGNYRSARGQYELAVANYNSTLTKALQDVADVAVSEKSQNIRSEKTKEALEQSTKAYEIAQNRYKGGLATYIDVLTAEDDMIDNQRAYADIQSRDFSLDVALVKALGGGFKAN